MAKSLYRLLLENDYNLLQEDNSLIYLEGEVTYYTVVKKPFGGIYTNVLKEIAGFPLYGSAIYGLSRYGTTNNYITVSKPTGSSYTQVAKPTIWANFLHQ